MVEKEKSDDRGQQARQLPIVKINGKSYYIDERLREFRAVDDPFDRIPLQYEFHFD